MLLGLLHASTTKVGQDEGATRRYWDVSLACGQVELLQPDMPSACVDCAQERM